MTKQQSTPELFRRSPYLTALRTPGALAFSAAGILARLQISMFGLGVVLFVSSTTRHYGLAGEVAAASAAGYAVVGPLTARFADRHGQRASLPGLAAVYTAATIGLVGGVEAHAPDWTLLVASGVAGASTPQIGSMVRARWSALLEGSALLHAAFSLESVADEVIFVAGPVVVTLLATQVHPAAGVAMAALTCVVGTLLLAAQRRTEPPARRVQRTRRTRRDLLPAEGLLTLVPVFLFFGAMLAAIDLSTVAFVTKHGQRPLAGVVLGGYALGSAAGGLWYGARTWSSTPRRRLVVTLLATAAGTSTFAVMPGVASLAGAMIVSGVVLSPLLITGFSLIEQQTSPHRLTEALAWITSAISVGTAVGSAAAGRIVDTGGAAQGYGLAAVCAAVAALSCVVGLGRLKVGPR